MRKIRLISFICVLVLALSMCSVFSFAATPEDIDMSDVGTYASIDFRVVAPTSVYSNEAMTNVLYSVSKGIGLTGSTSQWSYTDKAISVARNGVSGYINCKKIAPRNDKLCTITTAGTLYTGANGQTVVISNVPVGTYVYKTSTVSMIGNTAWFGVRVYLGSNVHTGWMKASTMSTAP